MKVTIKQVTPWLRALNAARLTNHVEPAPDNHVVSDGWKAKMLRAEHSPIRLVEYDILIEDIPYWVAMHLVRHHVGCEKFVVTQRDDRTNNEVSRAEQPQGALVSLQMTCNAQALINISRKRLCRKASTETRDIWLEVKLAMSMVDPIMADAMVADCVYRGACFELKCCRFVETAKYDDRRWYYLLNGRLGATSVPYEYEKDKSNVQD